MKNKKVINVLRFLILFLILLIASNFIFIYVFKEKRELTNNYKSFNGFEGIYWSSISEEFEKYLQEKEVKIIKQDFPFIEFSDGRIGDTSILFSYYDKANNQSLYNLKQAMTEKFGGNFDLLNNIRLLEEDKDFLFLSINKNILFDNTFDFNKDKSIWGINENSNSILFNKLKLEYVKDESNYCVSLKDYKGDTLIFLKNNNFNSFEEAWNYYLSNKNNLNSFMIGEDSIAFKSIQINQIGCIEELSNYKNNELKLQDYYVMSFLSITGAGKTAVEGRNLLNKSKIKYNFVEDTILFIIKDGELRPFLAYKY